MNKDLALKKGTKYNKYISKSTCKINDLGTGNTFHTVKKMKDWVMEHNYQVKKLAPLLKGTTVAHTISNIHSFLNDHIAYKADGALQIIKSPACMWQTRLEGTDCKTFSVAASCLLINLGIPHAIRQVKQPFLNPTQYTHVYVVIPVNPKDSNIIGNYFVLDGTVKINKEVIFSKKEDQFMDLQHQGLASPATSGLQLKSSTQEQFVYQNFIDFLNMLIDSGIPRSRLIPLKNCIDTYLSQGKDPSMNDVLNRTGLAGGLQNKPVLDDQTNEDIGRAIASAAGDIIDSGFLSRTFGAVFGNGFRLGCWNTATNPRESERLVKLDASVILVKSGITQTNMSEDQLRAAWDRFIQLAYMYQAGLKHLYSAGKYSKCSRDGWRAAAIGMDVFFNSIKSELTTQLQISGGTLIQQMIQGSPIMVSKPNLSFRGDLSLPSRWALQTPTTVTVPVYNLVKGTQTVIITGENATTVPNGSNSSRPTGSNSSGNPFGKQPAGGSQPTLMDSGSGINTGASKFGGGYVLPVLLVGIAGGAYYLNKKKTK